MTSIRPDGYCKECGGYTQAICFDISGLCTACEGNQEMIEPKLGTPKSNEWREPDREVLMKQWDHWRKRIAMGDESSMPRDWFQNVLDLFEPTEYLKEKDKWKN